jgi:hypothetical protein
VGFGKIELRPAINLAEQSFAWKRSAIDERNQPVQWMDDGNEKSQEHCGYLLVGRVVYCARDF